MCRREDGYAAWRSDWLGLSDDRDLGDLRRPKSRLLLRAATLVNDKVEVHDPTSVDTLPLTLL
jgi:hypothetical protein